MNTEMALRSVTILAQQVIVKLPPRPLAERVSLCDEALERDEPLATVGGMARELIGQEPVTAQLLPWASVNVVVPTLSERTSGEATRLPAPSKPLRYSAWRK
jgi:hypothetical protein